MQTIIELVRNNWQSILAGLGGIVVLFYVIRTLFIPLRLSQRELIQMLWSERQRLSHPPKSETKDGRLEEAVEKKKNALLNTANISFHYANKDEIRSFYNDYFKEPTVEQIVTEMATELSTNMKGSLPKILETKVGGKDLSKWISTLKLPDISIAEMFRRYQRETIKNNQVTLGLELVDVDLSDLNEFNESVAQLSVKFGFTANEADLEAQRSRLKKKAIENTLVRLETANGPILIEGKFKITRTGEGFYKCIYDHPVNEYTSGESNRITISFLLKADSIEPSIAGNYAQSIDRSIPLRVYGKVWQPIDRRADIYDLQITPTAVY